MTPNQVAGAPQLTVAEMAAACEEAHKAGFPVAAHAESDEGVRNAVLAGVDLVEHGHGATVETLRLMIERGTALTPTILSDRAIIEGGVGAGIPQFVVDKCVPLGDALIETVRNAFRLGVTITAGNDGGAPLVEIGQMADELALYVEHGLSPVKAIESGTLNTARLFRLERRRAAGTWLARRPRRARGEPAGRRSRLPATRDGHQGGRHVRGNRAANDARAARGRCGSRPVRIVEEGVVSAPEPGTARAVAKQVHSALLPDGEILVTYRIGAGSDTENGTAELRRSRDGGRTWSEPEIPWSTSFGGRRGTIYAPTLTVLAPDHLLACILWVDREAFPGAPLFNPVTEGCLPMKILLADSSDRGVTWTPWREVAVPDGVGPPSLTSPVRRLGSGRLLLSIESNKEYLDDGPWFQRVVYLYSSDEGRTWTPPVTVCQDPTGRIRNWDQRVIAAPDGRLVSFSWIYDSETVTYHDIARRISTDEGRTWSEPGAARLPGSARSSRRPARRADRVPVGRPFPDGVAPGAVAASIDAPFRPEDEVVLFALPPSAPPPEGEGVDGGEALVAMQAWTFGTPFALPLPIGRGAGHGLRRRATRRDRRPLVPPRTGRVRRRDSGADQRMAPAEAGEAREVAIGRDPSLPDSWRAPRGRRLRQAAPCQPLERQRPSRPHQHVKARSATSLSVRPHDAAGRVTAISCPRHEAQRPEAFNRIQFEVARAAGLRRRS